MIFKKSNVMDFNLEVSLPRLTQEETQYTSDKIILREAGNNKVLRFSDLYNYAKYNNKSIQESVTDIERENHIANPVFVVNETQYYLDEDYRNAVSDLSVFSKLMFDSNPESGLIYNAMMEAVDYSLENNNTSLLDAVIEEVVNNGSSGPSAASSTPTSSTSSTSDASTSKVMTSSKSSEPTASSSTSVPDPSSAASNKPVPIPADKSMKESKLLIRQGMAFRESPTLTNPQQNPNNNSVVNQAGKITNGIVNRVDTFANRQKQKFFNVLGNFGGKVAQGAADYMQNNSDKVANAVGNVAAKGTNLAANRAFGTMQDRVRPYVNGAKIGAGLTAILGSSAMAFNNLTNQDTLNQHSGDKSFLAKAINQLNAVKNKLSGRQVPPQQQGIFSKIMSKINAAIEWIKRKLGMN